MIDISKAQIKETKQYSKFTLLNGNRKIDTIHVERLKFSMCKKQLFSPIIVNQKYQIVDGQHRYHACKELKLPIQYIVAKNYGLKEVQALNTNTSNWTKLDFLNAYCKLGFKKYIEMKKFMDRFPDFGIAAAEIILNNTTTKNRDGYNSRFQDGTLFIENIRIANENANKILNFKPFYEGFNRKSFVSAMIHLFDHPEYNHEEMLSKIAKSPVKLRHCLNAEDYKSNLDTIFNFRRKNKKNIRF